MFFETGKHNTPHFHAVYQDTEASFRIDDKRIIAGDLPNKQRRLVEAWTELHEKVLKTAWELLQSGELPNKINPLN